MDAVEQSVLAMEDDPTFDAGTGGFLNRDGDEQLDALIIDGAAVDFGAIAGVRRIKNPILLARAVMEQMKQVNLLVMMPIRSQGHWDRLGRKRNARHPCHTCVLQCAKDGRTKRHGGRNRDGQ